MSIQTTYKVEQMVGFQKWKEIYSTVEKNLAENFARGAVTLQPRKRFMMLEIESEDGKLKSINKYGINPPWWSGELKILPRGAEIFLRGKIEL